MGSFPKLDAPNMTETDPRGALSEAKLVEVLAANASPPEGQTDV